MEYVIHKLVEERVDIKSFEDKIKNDETGRPAYDPKILLKIILLSYSRGIISSRKIEQACRENVIFMAISGTQCPDHSTIANFVATMEEEKIDPYIPDVDFRKRNKRFDSQVKYKPKKRERYEAEDFIYNKTKIAISVQWERS